MRSAFVLDLPSLAYETALDLQRAAVQARRDGRLERDLLIFLEHPPVFTLGRRGGRENLLVAEGVLQQRNIRIVPIERGGNITYHGPGQLVVYVLMDLKIAPLSVTGLVEGLERAMVRTAACWGIEAHGNPDFRGAWVQQRKLGSVGITIRRGISFHGLALNVNTDLEPFTWINPCGLSGCRMTSLARETSSTVDMARVRRQMAAAMAEVFDLKLAPLTLPAVQARLDCGAAPKENSHEYHA